MNAGGVPNTCKSSGVYIEEAFGWKVYKLSGGRVSNAWATNLDQGDNIGKPVLIPHSSVLWHHEAEKDLSDQDGPASD